MGWRIPFVAGGWLRFRACAIPHPSCAALLLPVFWGSVPAGRYAAAVCFLIGALLKPLCLDLGRPRFCQRPPRLVSPPAQNLKNETEDSYNSISIGESQKSKVATPCCIGNSDSICRSSGSHPRAAAFEHLVNGRWQCTSQSNRNRIPKTGC